MARERRRRERKIEKKMKFTVWGRELQWRTSGRESTSFPTVSIEIPGSRKRRKRKKKKKNKTRKHVSV